MIRFETNQPGIYNDISDVIRLYFGMEKIAGEGDADTVIVHTFAEDGGRWRERCALRAAGKPAETKELYFPAPAAADRLTADRLMKRCAKLCLYALLKEHFGWAPPWGSLTGIRPTKLARQLIDEGLDETAAVDALQGVFDVSAPKARLVGSILEAQRGIYAWGDRTAFDVYVSIPFCRTRCLYCSFFSADLRKPGLVRPYVDALVAEINALGELMRARGRRCRAVYVGGGTPVSIETAELARVLEALASVFPGAGETTVEAGRPDCITPENMRLLARSGAGRVSINPQTMVDRTLAAVGRGHTAADVLAAYRLAREAGIGQINMDVIVGLPGEGLGDVRHTLGALSKLDMDNLTVHTLAIKHSSRLNERLAEYPLPGAEEAAAMLEAAQAFAADRGMRPYYMYRQKYMAGNLENVGYALPGAECVYNVDMMEETHDIVALGAGAVSKRMFFDENRHERCPNPKNIEYYIQRTDDMIRAKYRFYGDTKGI